MRWAFSYNSLADLAGGSGLVISTRKVTGRERGFSLLEMVVAVAILGFSLGALYQAAGGLHASSGRMSKEAMPLSWRAHLLQSTQWFPARV